MATVILARHGRSTANTAGVLAGRTKGVHLDELGKEQAAAAGDRLSGLRLAALVTSPLERCRETTSAIAARQQDAPPLHREKGLLECDYGDWSGRELKGLAKEPLWRTVQAHPAAAAFPGGESLAAMMARTVAAVRAWDRRVEEEHGPDAVWLAVSHGDPIKAVVADALGMHLDLFQRIMVDPASLSVIRFTAHRPFVVSLNTGAGDLTHLGPPKKGRRRRSTKRDADAVVGGGAGRAGSAGA